MRSRNLPPGMPVFGTRGSKIEIVWSSRKYEMMNLQQRSDRAAAQDGTWVKIELPGWSCCLWWALWHLCVHRGHTYVHRGSLASVCTQRPSVCTQRLFGIRMYTDAIRMYTEALWHPYVHRGHTYVHRGSLASVCTLMPEAGLRVLQLKVLHRGLRTYGHEDVRAHTHMYAHTRSRARTHTYTIQAYEVRREP